MNGRGLSLPPDVMPLQRDELQNELALAMLQAVRPSPALAPVIAERFQAWGGRSGVPLQPIVVFGGSAVATHRVVQDAVHQVVHALGWSQREGFDAPGERPVGPRDVVFLRPRPSQLAAWLSGGAPRPFHAAWPNAGAVVCFTADLEHAPLVHQALWRDAANGLMGGQGLWIGAYGAALETAWPDVQGLCWSRRHLRLQRSVAGH